MKNSIATAIAASCVLIAGLLAGVAPASAGAGDVAGINGLSCEYATIQEAINAVPTDQKATVRIQAGTYNEALTIPDNLIVTIKRGDANCAGNLSPDSTQLTLGALPNSRNITMGDTTVTISGMSIVGFGGVLVDGGGVLVEDGTLNLSSAVVSNHKGVNTDGAGVQAIGSAVVTVDASTLSDNTTDGDGGAIHVGAGAQLIVESGVFADNESDGNGGAIDTATASVTTIDNGEFTNNSGRVVSAGTGTTLTVTNSQFNGGNSQGAAISGSTVIVDNSSFVNHRSSNGGAIFASDVTVTNSIFDSNELERPFGGSVYTGGAISATTIDITGSTFTAHHATPCDPGAGGAGCGSLTARGGVLYGANITLRDSSLDESSVAGIGSGIYVTDTLTVIDSSFDSSDIYSEGDTTVTGLSNFLSSRIDVDVDGSFSMTGPATCDAPTYTYCASISGYGFGDDEVILNKGSLTLDRVAVIDNDVNSAIVVGDDLPFTSADATLTNVLITDRPDTSERAIRVMQPNDSVTLDSVTIAAFTRGLFGGGIWDVSNTITNDPNDFAGTVTGDCNLSTDGTLPGSLPGNPDPQFEAGSRSRYELAATSPAIDACSGGPSSDIDGNARPAGLSFDIGTYEKIDQLTLLPSACVVYDSVLSGDELLTPGVPRAVSVAGAALCVPAGASAAVLTVTALDSKAPGNLRLSAAGVVPKGGLLNYVDNGLNNTNTVTVPLSAGGAIDVTANSGITGVRITTTGYYSSSGTLRYFPVTPCAVADSRPEDNPEGSFVGPFAAGAAYPNVDVIGEFSPSQGAGNTDCGVPSGADGVVVNVVAIGATGGNGGLAVGSGADNPTQNTTSFAPIGLNNAATAVVPVHSGELALNITGSGTTHVRLVVLGYLDTVGGDNYAAINPCAVFDSRTTIPDDTNVPTGVFAGKRTAGTANINTTGTTTYQVTGPLPAEQGGETVCGVPTGASAVLINLVAIQPDATGNFRAFATGSTPTGGVLTFTVLSPLMNNSNAVVVPLAPSGKMDLFVNSPDNNGIPIVHARGVVVGYFG